MPKDKLVKVVQDAITFESEQVNGPMLLELSIEQMRKEYGEKLIAFTTGTMNQVRSLQDQIDRLQLQLKFQLDRLNAIKENQFNCSRDGRILFNEDRLNEGLW